MWTVAAVTVALAVAGGATPAGPIQTEDGWYQLEEGYGETPDSEVAIVVAEDPAPAGQPEEPPADQAAPVPPKPPGGLQQEIEDFFRIDCHAVRGRYLERLLELHGMNAFVLDRDLLAAWTYQRPASVAAGPYGYGAAWSDPALAPLYGEPPIPPGALSYDLTLQTYARQLLECQQPPPGPPVAPPVAPPGAGGGGDISSR
jgi:hypothetical protein